MFLSYYPISLFSNYSSISLFSIFLFPFIITRMCAFCIFSTSRYSVCTHKVKEYIFFLKTITVEIWDFLMVDRRYFYLVNVQVVMMILLDYYQDQINLLAVYHNLPSFVAVFLVPVDLPVDSYYMPLFLDEFLSIV